MTTASPTYSGHITYIYAFDIAYEMLRQPGSLQTLLGQPIAQFQVDVSKRTPRQFFFYRPEMVRLPPLERIGPYGPIRVERSVKIFSVGAISITLRIPFTVHNISDLVQFHDLTFSTGQTVHDEVIILANEIHKELRPHLIRPVERLSEDEAYTVFSITSSLDLAGNHQPAEQWLEANRRQIAALITEESDLTHLSAQEAEESTSRSLSYYDHDLVVVDWDAALVVDEPRYIDETIYLMELANLQLAELEAYDRLLDTVVDRAYRDIAPAGHNPLRRPRTAGSKTLRDLREIRIDLARLSDELSNITKFFGDWHLARIYQSVAARFHLADWHKTIDEKLKTLDDLYQLLQSDRNNRYILFLEFTMCVLFIIDVILLIRGAR